MKIKLIAWIIVTMMASSIASALGCSTSVNQVYGSAVMMNRTGGCYICCCGA